MKFMNIIILSFLFCTITFGQRPRISKSFKIIDTLKRLEKQKRTGRGGLKLDAKTFDFLHRKSVLMGVNIQAFQHYIFENRKNPKVIKALEKIFEISINSKTTRLKKLITNKLLGLLVRLDRNKRARFKIRATDILKAIETWKLDELKELSILLSEVARDAEANNESPNKVLLELLNPVFHDQLKRKCL